jgi:hypothetical protein
MQLAVVLYATPGNSGSKHSRGAGGVLPLFNVPADPKESQLKAELIPTVIFLKTCLCIAASRTIHKE